MMNVMFCIPLPDGNISLRPFSVDDVERTYEWVSNPWYTGEFAGSAAPTPESHRKYFKSVLADCGQVFLAVCVDGTHIGNAGLKYFNGASCECWYYIGDEAQRGRNYANAIVRLLCRVVFSVKGIECVRARVLTTNLKSSRALLLNGFEECGMFSDEKGGDFVIYEKRKCQDEHRESFA